MNVVIRLALEKDIEFVFRVFAESRCEFQNLGWDAAHLEAFLREQFDFQQRTYASRHSYATKEIIVADGVDCGYQVVDRSGQEIILVDLAVKPDFQARRVGSKVLEHLLELASRSRQNVVLQVAVGNPAQGLYERFGFSVVGEHGMYRSMRWSFKLEKTAVAA